MHENPYINLPCRVDKNAIIRELITMIKAREKQYEKQQ